MVPRYLQEFIREGKVIPFVGAGVSMAVRRTDGERCYPSWNDLLSRAATRLSEEGKPEAAAEVQARLAEGDYLGASTRARKALRSHWYRFLKSQLSFRRKEIDDESLALARAIWGLGSSLIITTNYDRVLLWGCPELPDLHRWDIDAPYEQVTALRDGVDAPTLWHLHGLIDNVTKLILTPDGYQRLYPDLDESDNPTRQRHQAALNILQRHLASFSFLFIGFSLDDAALLEQLQQVDRVFDGAAATHYILVREAERGAMLAKIDQWELPVNVVTFADFGQPLIDSLHAMARFTWEPEELGGDAVLSPSKPPGPPPTAAPQPKGPSAPAPPRAAAPMEDQFEALDDDEEVEPREDEGLETLLGVPTPASASKEGREQPMVPVDAAAPRAGRTPPEQERKKSVGARTRAKQAPAASGYSYQRLLALSKALYAKPLQQRKAAARQIADVAATVPLDSLLSLADSPDPEQRAAAGLGLRTHFEIDPRGAIDPRVLDTVQRGLSDDQARVRYRFVEAVQSVPALIRHLHVPLTGMLNDPSATVASKARETLRLETRAR